MTNNPVVSVIIATFNGATRLPLQLEALSEQKDAPDFEVIIVDNGSTDNTVAVAQQWRERLNVRIVSASDQQGIAFARNTGIANAKATKLAFCDDDDVVGQSWVAHASRYLDDEEFVSGRGVELEANQFTSVERVRTAMRDSSEWSSAYPSPTLGDYPILLGGNCAILAETVKSLGGFDTSFDPGAEEKDLVLRYQESGGVLMFAPSMQLAVRLRPTTKAAWRRSFQHGRMYMKLVDRHGLWSSSPVVNKPDFRLDLFKSLGAASKNLIKHQATWSEIGSRIALRSGQMVGWIEYIVLPSISLRRKK